jgi:hypothetical protein
MNQNSIELTINVSIRQNNFGGGSLQLNNSITLGAKDFLAMCMILGEFQKLSDKFKQTEQK